MPFLASEVGWIDSWGHFNQFSSPLLEIARRRNTFQLAQCLYSPLLKMVIIPLQQLQGRSGVPLNDSLSRTMPGDANFYGPLFTPGMSVAVKCLVSRERHSSMLESGSRYARGGKLARRNCSRPLKAHYPRYFHRQQGLGWFLRCRFGAKKYADDNFFEEKSSISCRNFGPVIRDNWHISTWGLEFSWYIASVRRARLKSRELWLNACGDWETPWVAPKRNMMKGAFFWPSLTFGLGKRG